MYKTYFHLSLLFVFSFTAFSQETDFSEPETESWYTYWGIGYSSSSYPADIKKETDILKKQKNLSRQPLSLDVLGFYWHMTPQTIYGFIINGAADRYRVDDYWMQVNQYLFAASMMHYIDEPFGSGFFVRTDLGISAVNQSYESVSIKKGYGLGLLGGGGWSFDLGGTRLLLNINYSYRSVKGDGYKTLGLSVGGLF